MLDKDAREILERFKAGDATPEDEVLLENWLLQYRLEEYSGLTDQDLERSRDRMLDAVFKRGKTSKSSKLWTIAGIAAAVFIVISSGILFYTSRPLGPLARHAEYKNDIAPGSVGATLTLSDGKKISLAQAGKGRLGNESGVTISKTAEGDLLYSGSETAAGEHAVNILTTARGEVYRVQLPDGSAVWLNAASSLKFPVSFKRMDQRIVELDGEAYFEIAKDKSQPFVVRSETQDVEVLGTHFNVNAYSDKKIVKTTLLEGGVRVSGKRKGVAWISENRLAPGEQSVNTEGRILVAKADIEQVMAWKKGNFSFNGEGITDIMKELERWYNIEVVYDSQPTTELYYADISRYKNISEVLSLLEDARGVHFKIQGRRVVVMK